MPNRLNIPSELNSLIEKREGQERRQENQEPTSHETSSDREERRSGEDRRQVPQDNT